MVAVSQVLSDQELRYHKAQPVSAGVTSPDLEAVSAWPVSVEIDPLDGVRWRGVRLTAPAEGWNLAESEALLLTIANTGAAAIRLGFRADGPGGDDGVHRSVTTRFDLGEGEQRQVRLELRRLHPRVPDSQLFGMWRVPEEAAGDTRDRIDASRVTRLHVFADQPEQPVSFVIQRIAAVGKYDGPAPVPDPTFFPMIDTFGQFMHRDWPGKTMSRDAMLEQIQNEAAELAAHPRPGDWDEYGGWRRGPQLEATGYFRTHKHEGRWWLVTPEGRLFWAHGINAVGEHDYTPIDGREHWFADPLWEQEAYKQFLRQAPRDVVRGHYKGTRPRIFSFHQANLLRKYGPEWRSAYAELAHRRLRSWGFNAIGTWSDPAIFRHPQHRTPYFALAYTDRARPIEGSSGWWRSFPDPFDPSFKQAITDHMQHLQRQGVTDDPWCIGFFVDNENTWKHDTYLAEATLQSPADQPAKRVFIEDLRSKYGRVEALNLAWGSEHASWEAMLEHQGIPEIKTGAAEDLRAFYAKLADAYFAGSRDAVKAIAPNHLYLGCRFPYQVNALVTEAAKQSCDVMSVNWYQYTVDGFEVPGGLDLPLIIGEFHFGALDRGLFHTGLKAVPDQDARAAAYTRYVQGALRHPNIVGLTWFKFSDEPNTGRWLDTENYQIGFLDVCDTPYPETVEAARSIGRAMYETRAHK